MQGLRDFLQVCFGSGFVNLAQTSFSKTLNDAHPLTAITLRLDQVAHMGDDTKSWAVASFGTV